eukprot:6936005-Karenia_brevis.AAC.1
MRERQAREAAAAGNGGEKRKTEEGGSNAVSSKTKTHEPGAVGKTHSDASIDKLLSVRNSHCCLIG